jgi:hypothetical protein
MCRQVTFDLWDKDHRHRPGAEFFDDLAIIGTSETAEEPPEPLKRVRVVPSYGVHHAGIRYLPNAVAEVPESLADHWLKSRWVTLEDPEAVTDVGHKARKRGSRPKPE